MTTLPSANNQLSELKTMSGSRLEYFTLSLITRGFLSKTGPILEIQFLYSSHSADDQKGIKRLFWEIMSDIIFCSVFHNIFSYSITNFSHRFSPSSPVLSLETSICSRRCPPLDVSRPCREGSSEI